MQSLIDGSPIEPWCVDFEMMKTKLLAVAVFALAAVLARGALAEAAITMDIFPEARLHEPAALQNGVRLFANYCLNCHSANLMRWNRLRDIGLDEHQISDFLIFGNQKVGDTMSIALRPADSKAWLGKTPPDLSVIARARTSSEYRGTDYLYTLLRGFYRDRSTPTGWNNSAYPTIAMPHVFWERQGPREATFTRIVHRESEKTHSEQVVREVTVIDADGNANVTESSVFGDPPESVEVSFKPADPKRAAQFDSDVADLVAFLTFMSEPSAAGRVRMGVWVLLFLAVLAVFTWWLNRAYWKDIK